MFDIIDFFIDMHYAFADLVDSLVSKFRKYDKKSNLAIQVKDIKQCEEIKSFMYPVIIDYFGNNEDVKKIKWVLIRKIGDRKSKTNYNIIFLDARKHYISSSIFHISYNPTWIEIHKDYIIDFDR